MKNKKKSTYVFKKISSWLPEKKHIWLAILLFSVSIVITAITSITFTKQVLSDANTRFNYNCIEIKEKISVRLHAYAQLLQSNAAFFEENKGLSREEWRDIYKKLKIEENLPGILGLGFSKFIKPGDLDSHTKAIRKEGFPDYSVKPEGKRDIYTSIIYLEPFSGRNLRAFGYDMYSEPVRRKAMEAARDFNVPYISGKITLVQETDKDVQAGTLMYVPVFNKDLPYNSAEERRIAILGWVYSPFRMNDLMLGIMGNAEQIKNNSIRLEISDSPSFDKASVLFDSKIVYGLETENDPWFTLKTNIDFNGHNWYLAFNQYKTSHTSLDFSSAWGTAIGGTFVSILIFVLYLSLSSTNLRVRKLAAEVTQDLSDSEGKYRSIFNNEIYAISILDLETQNFIDVNERHCKLYGYTRDEFLSGMTIKDLGQDMLLNASSVENLIVRGTSFIPICFHRKKDGTVFPVEIVGGPFKWKGKRVVFSLVHDISTRIKAEDQLKKWAHIFENAKWGIVVASPDGKYIELINPEYASMHGFTIEELKGKLIIDLFAPERRSELAGKIELANKEGHFIWESEHLRKDGSIFPVRMDVTTVKDEKGNILYRVVNVQDITERKSAEDALKQSEEKFKLLLNSAAEAIYGLDMNGNCTFCNQAAIELLGLEDENEVLGKNMHNIIHYAHADGSEYHMKECKVFQAFQEGKGTHIDDEVLWRRDGTSFPAEYWSYPMYKDNEVIGSVVTFIDITERKNVERQLQQYNEKLEDMNRTKDRFFTIIAHDLKSPFIGLLGYSNILANEYETLSEDEKINFIKSIDELGHNTFRLLENLLEWARLQTGKMTFNPEKFNLLPELHPTLNIVKQTALNKNIEFIYDIDNSIFVHADKNMLLTIIRNLISNAVKFTHPGGKIIFTSKPDADKIEFSVTDNGVGIDEMNLTEIFKVAKGKTTPGTANETGTGLGLLLCKEMVEKHGGTIIVVSQPGKGTTISFNIPN